MRTHHSQQEIATVNQALTTANHDLSAEEPVEKKKVRLRYTKRITYIAVLTAIAVVLKTLGNMFTIVGFRISFTYIAWIVAGVMLGPIGGAAVGLISDAMGTLIGGLPPNPLLLLSSTLFPVFPALFYRLPLKNEYLKVVLGSVVSLVVCSLGISTIGLMYIYNMSFFKTLVTYRLAQVGVFAVNLVCIGLLFPVIKRTFLKE